MDLGTIDAGIAHRFVGSKARPTLNPYPSARMLPPHAPTGDPPDCAPPPAVRPAIRGGARHDRPVPAAPADGRLRGAVPRDPLPADQHRGVRRDRAPGGGRGRGTEDARTGVVLHGPGRGAPIGGPLPPEDPLRAGPRCPGAGRSTRPAPDPEAPRRGGHRRAAAGARDRTVDRADVPPLPPPPARCAPDGGPRPAQGGDALARAAGAADGAQGRPSRSPVGAVPLPRALLPLAQPLRRRRGDWTDPTPPSGPTGQRSFESNRHSSAARSPPTVSGARAGQSGPRHTIGWSSQRAARRG